MLKKIRNGLIAILVLSLAIALWRTDWKGEFAPASDFESFGNYASRDVKYAQLYKKHKEIDGLLHPIDKLQAYRDKKEYELKLRALYEIKEVPQNYVAGLTHYVFFSFKSQITSIKTWLQAGAIIGFIFAFSVLSKAVVYYVIAPLFVGRKLKLFAGDGSGAGAPPGGISFDNGGKKVLSVSVESGQSLVVLNEDYINGYVDDESLSKRTRWLFSWKYPFMSFFCGLRAMNQYSNKGVGDVRVDITSDDPNEYFIEICLHDCRGAFIVPSTIKAYTDGLGISLVWRPFSLTALCLKRIRFYKVSGSGKIILSASGGFNGYELSDRRHRHKPSSLVFADIALVQTLARTETFYPFLCGRTDLFDLQIQGQGKFIAKNTTSLKRVIDKLTSSDAILNGIGKLLGF